MQERLRLYTKKVEKVESEKWLKEHKPALSLSIAAANRFITNAIPDLSAEQKTALRQVCMCGMVMGRCRLHCSRWDAYDQDPFVDGCEQAGRAQKEKEIAQAPLEKGGERRAPREEADAFLDSLQAADAVPGGKHSV